MTTPDRLWRDNPYIPGKNNLQDIRDMNQQFVAGAWANKQVRSAVEFMYPEEAANYSEWARAHPQLDPNLWVPLAKTQVDPYSDVAHSLVLDQAANDRTRTKMPGQDDGPEAAPTPSTEPDAGSDDGGGFWGAVTGAASDVLHVGEDAVTISSGIVAKGPLTLARIGQTAFMAPYQYMQGTARSNLGAEQHRQQLFHKVAKAQGLPMQDRTELRALLLPDNNSINSVDELADRARQSLDTFGYDDATKKRMLDAIDVWQKFGTKPDLAEAFTGAGPGEGLAGIIKPFMQTDAGIIARSFVDGTKGNYLTSEPQWGSTYDPKSGKWVNPDTGEDAPWVGIGNTVFNPSGVSVERDFESLKAYDIRTLEEKKNGVSPTPWTLGRQVAQTWYSPDTQAFDTLSGVVDIGASLTMDPINLLPAGAFSKLGPMTLKGSAFAGLGRDVLVATRGQQVAGITRLESAATGAREGAVLGAKGADDLDLVLDPVMSMRGYAIDGRKVVKPVEGEAGKGVVNVPHAKYVMKEDAYRYLTTNREGIDTVDALAKNDSAWDIWVRSGGKMDGALAIQLAQESSPEAVRAIIGSRIGVDIKDAAQFGRIGGAAPWLGKVPVAGPTLSRGFGVSGRALESSGLFTTRGRDALKRMYGDYGMVGATRSVWRDPFRVAPSSGVGFHIDDIDSVLDETTNWLRGTRGFTDEEIRVGMDKVMKATNGVDRYYAMFGENGEGGLIHQLVKKLTGEYNLPESKARQITRAFAGGIDPEQRIFNNSDLGPTSFGAAADGAQGRALILNEMLGTRMYMPDYRTLRRATGVLSRLYHNENVVKVAGERAATVADEKTDAFANGLHAMSGAWRNAVLVRGAFPLRDIGEQAFALSLAGGPGAFTRPDLFVARFMQAALAMEIQHTATKVLMSPFTGVYKGVRGAVDGGVRAIVTDPSEKKAWESFASLPDEQRPRQLRGLDEKQIGDLWEKTPRDLRAGNFWYAADRQAMREYMALHEGAQWLFPGVRSSWARLNGESMFGRLAKAAEGDDEALTGYYHELNATSGNMLIDEPVMRRAAKYVDQHSRDKPEDQLGYAKALIDNHLAGSSADTLMRRMAAGDDIHQILFDWRHTTDWALRRRMREDLWKPEGSPRRMDEITEAEDMQYLQGLSNNLRLMTGEDPKLLDAVATRRFEGEHVTSKNRKLVDHITKGLQDEDFRSMMPSLMHGVPQQMNRTIGRRLQKSVNNFFHWNGEMSDLWTRSPTIRHYWSQWVLDNVDELSPTAKSHAIAALRASGDIKLARQIARRQPRVIRGEGVRGSPSHRGTLGVEEMEAAASGYARKMTAKVFYNAHKRQNYALAMRTLMPFIQATFNTFKRWGLLSLQNPHMMYRTLKPIRELREPGSAVIYGILGNMTGDEGLEGMYSPDNPEASVDGFFFHNSYGDRQFMYPLVRPAYNYLWRPLFGGPEAPPGSLGASTMGGLNVAGTTVNPGLGPALTIPAVWFARDHIYHDDPYGKFLRWMFPYGYPTGESGNVIEKTVKAIAPTAFRKAMVTEDQQANLAMKLIPALMATGEYKDYPADRYRLMQDAPELASRVLWFSSIFGSFTPSTIQWQNAIRVSGGKDKDGVVRTYMLQDQLAKEFRKYTAPRSDESTFDDYAQGALNFFTDFGKFALFSVMPRSEQVGVPEAMQPTADVWSFRTDHPDVYEKYRAVIPFLFPGGDPSGEFGAAEENQYRWNISSGDQAYKTVNDFMDDSEAAIGWILYATSNAELIRQVPDADAQASYRKTLQTEINQKYPGWSPEGSPGGTDDAIDLLRQATHDADLQTLPGTPYIAQYIHARDEAINALLDSGYAGNLSSDYAAQYRAQLYDIGQSLVKKDTTGTFAYAWSRLFSGELEG